MHFERTSMPQVCNFNVVAWGHHIDHENDCGLVELFAVDIDDINNDILTLQAFAHYSLAFSLCVSNIL